MKQKILKLFFEQPSKGFQIREIARITNVPKSTVSRYVSVLIKQKLVKKEKKGVFPSYHANYTNSFFKISKKNQIIEDLCEFGLVEYIEETVHPKCIVLFGSFAKGEYDKKSDIDLFVQAEDQNIDLKKYEKALKHKINIFFEQDINKLSSELSNNIINGIKLSGYIKLK